ncbi:hypothetical protein D3C87_1375130 [compost metagenome]
MSVSGNCNRLAIGVRGKHLKLETKAHRLNELEEENSQRICFFPRAASSDPDPHGSVSRFCVENIRNNGIA